MKKTIILILSIVILFSACEFAPRDTVAEIDGKQITKSEYDFDLENYKNIYKNNADEEFSKLTEEEAEGQDIILKKGVLEKLVMRKTIEKEFERLGFILDEKAFEDKKESIIDNLGGNENYKSFLEKNGISEEFFDESIREEMMTNVLKDEFKKSFNPTEEELENYFNSEAQKLYRYDISIILVDSEEEAYKIIRSHEDFEKLAIKYSKEPISAVNGGKLHGVNPYDLPKELKNVIYFANLNEFLDPIKADDGYYVFRVDKAYTDYESLEDVTFDSMFRDNFKKHLEELRDANNVKVYIDITK